MTQATVHQLVPRTPAKAKRPTGRRGFGRIRKLPSGRFQARYQGPDGLQHTGPVTFQTKGDAGAYLSKVQTQITDQAWRPPARDVAVTLGEFVAQYMAARSTGPKPLAARTLSNYRRIQDRFILPALGNTPLARITPDVVARFYAQLDPNTPNMTAQAYSHLSTILNAAITAKLITSNPCQIPGAGTQPQRARKITPATVPQLATLVQAMPAQYQALVLLYGWCAIRYGEASELRRGDLDLDAGTVTITRAVSYSDPEGTGDWAYHVGRPKSQAGVRTVTIPPHVVPAIQAHLDTHVGPGPDALLFQGTLTGGHLRHSSFVKCFNRAKIRAGRPDLTPHQLRHTGATMAAQNGATLAELMTRLGHSTPRMALVYQHATSDRMRDLARRLSVSATGQDW